MTSASRGRIGLDILHLIEKLESFTVTSPRLPMVGKLVIDPQDILDLVDQMRIALPESVRDAQRVIDEQGRRPRQEMAPSLPPELRTRVDAHEVVKLAEQRAQEIASRADSEAEAVVEEARGRAAAIEAEAEDRRQGANEYAREVLSQLENQLSGMLATVQHGMAVLDRQVTGPPQPRSGGEGPY